ncbi:MAG: AsmA family protein [Proteobacteria bacterium]|nr:AsmA family protein [Pseudomonadota bacterium]
MSGIAKKSFKLLLSLVVVAVLFVVITTAIFLATFDANQYKQELSDLVRQETGRELEFFGDVDLTIYPALGMKLGAMSLSNAPGFGAQSMLKVNKVSISVDLVSLILFSPEVEQLLLDGLEINLEKNAQGVTNWDDLLKLGATESPGTSASKSPADTTATESMTLQGAFGGLNIRNARLSWKDAQAGVEYKVKYLDLSTGRITQDAPFSIEINMALESKDEIDLLVEFNSQVLYLINDNRLILTDFDLDLEATGSALPRGEIRLTVASQSVDFDLARNAIKLEGVIIDIDDSRLSGSLHLTDFTRPAMTFNFSSDLLDIDALLGTAPVTQPTEQPASEPTANETSEDVQILLPMELLRSLEVDGQLSVKQIKIQNLLLEDFSLKVSANNGVLNLDPIKMTLYQGSFEGRVQVDTRNKIPKYRVSKNFSGVQIGELLTDYLGEDRITGVLNASVNLRTRGEWLSALKKNSNGTMKLAFTDGALRGFNLRYSIDKARAKLKRQPAPSEQVQKTDFSALGLSGKIKNGIFSSTDLNLQAPFLRVGGEGKANLNNDTIDYLVRVKLVGSVAGQEGGELDEIKGLLIPVSIKGPFAAPEIDVLLDEMLRAQAQAKLKAEIEKQKSALKQQIQAEKEALAAAKQRELEKQKQVLEAKAKAALEKAKNSLLKKLLE